MESGGGSLAMSSSSISWCLNHCKYHHVFLHEELSENQKQTDYVMFL